MANKYWYAVLTDNEDNDWGTGSFDRDDAERMLAKYPDGLIAVIDGNYDEEGNPTTDPICIDLNEVKRLAREWDMTTEELLEQMHEATVDEISEWGAYNG